MSKTVLITGSTDGIGFEVAKQLAAAGHCVLLHGRDQAKLTSAQAEIVATTNSKIGCKLYGYLADLSQLSQVEALAESVVSNHHKLDILINNAGVLKVSTARASNGIDARFMINTIASYLLTKRLLPLLDKTGRVINVTSAAQASVNLAALCGAGPQLETMDAYSQSKLALIMWSRHLANSSTADTPTVIAVNPGSKLATKMVQEGFGVEGRDIGIGAKIIVNLALEDQYASASGQYFHNDLGRFIEPHPDALIDEQCKQVVACIEKVCKGS